MHRSQAMERITGRQMTVKPDFFFFFLLGFLRQEELPAWTQRRPTQGRWQKTEMFFFSFTKPARRKVTYSNLPPAPPTPQVQVGRLTLGLTTRKVSTPCSFR